jgi:hypothetical protein
MRRLRRAALASGTEPIAATASQGRPRSHIRAWQARVTRYRVSLASLLALVLAFYMWTAASSTPFSFSSSNNDLYNELTTGFLHGHTYLPITPPAGLLRLKNPYDPAQNAAYGVLYHDLSLYKGHFYSAWGPTPVLTLFAPFRLTGLRMSQSFAVALFGFVGLVCAVALLHLVVRRLVPGAPRWVLLLATPGLALMNTVPFLLRRPLQYEVAISSGYCFEMAGLLLVVASLFGPRIQRVRMAFGSLCLGLAVGGRPTLAVGGVVLLAVALWGIRRRGEGYSVLAYALGPFVFCGLLLALYNQIRFGGLTDFGQRYELAGTDQTKAPFYNLSYLAPGLFSYLLLPARLALTFPHAFLMTATSDPFQLPRGYAGSTPVPAAEPTGGVLTTIPITLMLLGLPGLWLERRQNERRALIMAGGLAFLGLVVVGIVSFTLFGTTQRYEVDFATLFVIPAFLIWGLLVARHHPGTAARRAIAIVGVVFVAFGSAVGVAASFTGYWDLLRIEHPAVFNALENLTSPFATLATIVVGRPEIARVDTGPSPAISPAQGYGSFTDSGASAWLGSNPVTVTIISPHGRRLGLTASLTAGPGTPPLSKLVIRVSSPGRRAVTVPLLSRYIRIPIVVHLGLNRIRLTLADAPGSARELLLGDLQLAS